MDALEIGYIIKDRRAQLGLTQDQVAQSAHVSKRCLWSLELGQNPGVQFNKLNAVLNALGLSVEIKPTEAKPEKSNFSESETTNNKAANLNKANSNQTPQGSAIAGENTFDALAILTGASK